MADTKADSDQTVHQELSSLQAVTASSAVWTGLDFTGRAEYGRLTRQLSDEIWARYKDGSLTGEQAARIAQQSRNEVMEAVRARSSPWGRARAQQLKARGKTLEALLDKYARQSYGRSLEALGDGERAAVFETVIKAAGRPNPQVTAAARSLGRCARVFWVVTFIIFIWDVSTATDKIRTAIRDVLDIAAGIGGSMAVGAAAGALFGPIGAIIGGLVGGVLFAVMTDRILDATLPPFAKL